MKHMNFKLQNFRLKFLMLGIAMLSINYLMMAQSFTTDTPPAAGTKYAGEEDTYTYQATGFGSGTTFFVYYDTFDEAHILGSATTQDADTDITFTWPDEDGAITLILAAYTGSDYEGNETDIDDGSLFLAGADAGDTYSIDFDRAGSRYLTTQDMDVSNAESVFFRMNLTDFALDVTNPVIVQYSIDGGTSYTTLTDTNGDDEYFGGMSGTFDFELPGTAKTTSTRFKISQTGSNSLANGSKTWRVNSLSVVVGELYVLEVVPGESMTAFTVDRGLLNITDVLDDVDASIAFGTAYPGDQIKIDAQLLNIDLTKYDFVVTLEDMDGNEYELESQTIPTKDNTTKEIRVLGTIPADIVYEDGMGVNMYAYPSADADPLFGLNLFADFTVGGTADDFTVMGGTEDVGTGLLFTDAGDRSVESAALNITSSEGGYLAFEIARANDLISPSGTDIIIEYTTDASTYTELASLALNEIEFEGSGSTIVEFMGADWPSGVISSSTQFRVRQEANNGADLDAWYLVDAEINSGTNIISTSRIELTSSDLQVLRPAITLDPLDIAEGTLAYPMTELDFTFTIDDGIFPSNTSGSLYLNRSTDPDLDIHLATIADITTESITFQVPPLEAGDYNLYLLAGMEEIYSSVSLPVYDLEINITSITFSDPITIGDEEYGYPGSDITVNYTIGGTPGAGAELMLNMYDDDAGEYTMIGATSTFNGSITATLPTDLDYGTSPMLELTVGTGIYDNNPFSVTEFEQNWYYNNPPEGFVLEGGGTYSSAESALFEEGTRSLTSTSFEIPYGGIIYMQMYAMTYDFTQEVKLEGSTNGSDWEEIAAISATSASFFNTGNITIPNSLWSDQTQFRVIYNEESEAGFQENIFQPYYLRIYTPEFMEASGVTDYDFNLIRPSIDVAEYVKTSFTIGEEVMINYNAQNFPTGTEFAAVIEQGTQYYVAGSSADMGAASITATMPIGLPIDPEDEMANYELSIVPFMPVTAGDSYNQGETIVVNNADDFLTVMGDQYPDDFDNFAFRETGERILLTRAFDLSMAETAEIQFDYNEYYDYNFDVNDNKNIVPRLQVSIDGGATFEEIPVYELADGEEQIYDDGLLYLEEQPDNGDYHVNIPDTYLTSATHFRWIQPLNLGLDQNRWSIEDIVLVINSGNVMPEYQYTTTANNDPHTVIEIMSPDLSDYIWVQADLDDAVFNGEDFDYSWDVDPDATGPQAFPSSTTFIFTIDETDPETNENIIIGTSTALGTATASIPSYVENGTYDVYVTAMVTVDGMDYYIYEEEMVATLDVFLRVVRTHFVFDENDVFYAGNTATFSFELENDETNTLGVDALFANLLVVNFDGSDDLLLETQQGITDMTVDLPPFIRGGDFDFEVRLTEGAALGDAGDIANFDDMGNEMMLISDDFISGDFVTLVETNDFYEYNFGSYDVNRTFSWNFDFDPVLAESGNGNERMYLQYSTNGGNSWSNYTNWTGPSTGTYNVNLSSFINGGGYNIPSGTAWERVRFRWIAIDPWCCVTATARGSQIEISNADISGLGSNLENNSSYFPNGGSTYGPAFTNDFGRGLMTTRDFEVGELDGYTLVSFDLTFDEVLSNMTADQALIFEYSIDAGASYTSIASLPSQDIYDDLFDGEEMAINDESFDFEITDEMKTNMVRFRFRQEERNEILVTLKDVSFIPSRILPFDYIGDNQVIASQALMITSLNATDACSEDDITLSYEIRGKFGADNLVMVNFKDLNGNTWDLDGFEFEITDGTGDITFNLPSDVIDAGDNNEFFRFQLEADDNTYEEINQDFWVTGVYSEETLEVIAPIEIDAEFYVDSQKSCSTEDIIVELDNPQDYFTYQLFNTADDSDLGSPLTYDPEVGDYEINIGLLTDPMEIGMRITSASSEGTTCNTITSIYTDELVILPDYVLYRSRDYGSNYIISSAETESVCEGDDKIRLRAGRIPSNSNSVSYTSNVEWFRNDLATPVASGTTTLDEFYQSGDYFARVTDGECIYLTESITIEVTESPDRPVVTVTSGSLIACEGEIEVVLTAPAGFAYYSWSNGETTPSITVEEGGSYTVQVSDIPFDNGCGSPSSVPVVVEEVESPEFFVRTDTDGNDEDNVVDEGTVLRACESEYIYFFENTSYANNGTVVIFKDGVEYASTVGNNFEITESGVYTATKMSDDVTVTCTRTIGNFTVTIDAQPTGVPQLTSTGNLEFCTNEGNSVTLTAPTGFTYYEWYRNGNSISSNTQGFEATLNTLEVMENGTYAVRVGNAAGCYGPASNIITVTTRNSPSIPGVSQSDAPCGEGAVTFSFNGDNLYRYQLINAITGLPSGNSVIGGDSYNSYITSEVISEETPFYMEVSYADGSGCVAFNEFSTFTGEPNNVNLELIGNTLYARIANYSGYSEIRWYRNGTELVNRNGNSSISVTDGAEYHVEVDFEGVGLCTVTSNSVDLAPSTPTARANGNLSANSNTYPNPTTGDVLNVEVLGTNFGDYSVSIMSMTGQVMIHEIFNKDVEEFTKSISIRQLQRGLYNLQIKKGDEVENIRILKN